MQKRHTTCRNSLARSVFVAISCLITVMIAAAADETAVRDLPIEIVTKLATEIYRQDTYAAEAADLLLQTPGGPSALESEGVRGLWVVTGNDREVIRFVPRRRTVLRPHTTSRSCRTSDPWCPE